MDCLSIIGGVWLRAQDGFQRSSHEDDRSGVVQGSAGAKGRPAISEDPADAWSFRGLGATF